MSVELENEEPTGTVFMHASWHWQLLSSSLFLLQYAEACFDSSGDFYCTTLWYFWFCLFWLFMFLFVGVVCIVNRCNKKNRQVDVQIQLPPMPRKTRSDTEKSEPPSAAATPGWTESQAAASPV